MRVSTIYTRIAIALLVLTQVQLFSCRSRKKTAALENASPSLSVTVLDLRKEDKGQQNFRYLLEGCGEGGVSGTLDEEATGSDPVVKFNVSGLEAGDQCSMDIKIDSLEAYPSKINFTDEELVMYKGDDSVVTQGLRGELVMSVSMKPNYFHEVSPLQPESSYTINLAVKFPENVANPQNLTAFLYCNPEVKHLPSSFNSTAGDRGVFTFKSIHGGSGPDEHSCSKLTIYNGDTRAYFANMNAASYKFAATAGQTIEFANQVVNVDKVVPPPSKVTLETIAKQCDPEKEVFDVNKRACVPRQE